MATIPRFEINGVVNTSNTVLQNLNDLCNSCGCWMTFDPNTGLWSVIINKPETSKRSFDDSNIIGSINISGTGINEFYNSVSVEFPHKDLRDQTDYVDLKIPDTDRFPNENDNKLQMSLKYINDPVQAAFIAQVELKQSRIDKIIEFTTDYTALGLKAGNVIDITSEVYGYDKKKFRITKLKEADADDGTIQISITALEYDETIYDDSGLVRTERTKKTGIVPKSMNTALTGAEAAGTAQQLAENAGVVTLIDSFSTPWFNGVIPDGNYHSIPVGSVKTAPYSGKYKISYYINWGCKEGLGGEPNPGVNGCQKTSAIIVKINGQERNLGYIAATGDFHVQLYEDHMVQGFFTANKGDNITYFFEYSTDFPQAGFGVVCEVTYVPTSKTFNDQNL